MDERPASRRRRRYGALSEEGGEINLTPLLDIIFNLLFFFVVATTIRTEESFFELILPESTEAPARDQAEAIPQLLVSRDGVLIFRGEQWEDEDALVEALREARGQAGGQRALLSSDGSAQVQQNVHAMDLLRRAGFEDVIQRVRSEPR